MQIEIKYHDVIDKQVMLISRKMDQSRNKNREIVKQINKQVK
jgi:hypothetical protein